MRDVFDFHSLQGVVLVAEPENERGADVHDDKRKEQPCEYAM